MSDPGEGSSQAKGLLNTSQNDTPALPSQPSSSGLPSRILASVTGLTRDALNSSQGGGSRSTISSELARAISAAEKGGIRGSHSARDAVAASNALSIARHNVGLPVPDGGSFRTKTPGLSDWDYIDDNAYENLSTNSEPAITDMFDTNVEQHDGLLQTSRQRHETWMSEFAFPRAEEVDPKNAQAVEGFIRQRGHAWANVVEFLNNERIKIESVGGPHIHRAFEAVWADKGKGKAFEGDVAEASMMDGSGVIDILEDRSNPMWHNPAAIQAEFDDAAEVSADGLFSDDSGLKDEVLKRIGGPSQHQPPVPDNPKNLRPDIDMLYAPQHEPQEGSSRAVAASASKYLLPSQAFPSFSSDAERTAFEQHWFSQWYGVLQRYTDDVWGPGEIQEAEETMEALRNLKSELDEHSWKINDVVAVQRLKMVLGHLSLDRTPPSGAPQAAPTTADKKVSN